MLEVTRPNSVIHIMGGLAEHQRLMLLHAFIDHGDLRAPSSFLDRADGSNTAL